ncbi:MAG TPA: hypothetical protein VLQ48_04675 [Chloroflexia bacterium]|nr:hypothetical protein [Chloroflexia bacterium]
MNTLRIIFIHGITPTVISWDFSESLAKLILKKLVQYQVVPEGATAEEIDQVVTFERVNYSMVGEDAQQRLLQAYEQGADKLYSFASRLSGIAGLDKIRRQIITSVSDVLVYKSEYWSHVIHQMVLDKIAPYIATGDPVSIIAHSLGSVVAFDTLFDSVGHDPKWKDADFRPTNLFTMGSPIALFTLDLEREPTHRGTPANTEESHTPLVLDEGVWYNFLDAQDVIAYPLEILFKDVFAVEDIVVQTGTNPHKAHEGYWDNDEVADFIAGRLKLDFLRINNTGAPDDGDTVATSDTGDTGEKIAPEDIMASDADPKEDEVPDEVSLVERLLDL